MLLLSHNRGITVWAKLSPNPPHGWYSIISSFTSVYLILCKRESIVDHLKSVPILFLMEKLTFCFDIDNTICHSSDDGSYDTSTPYLERIERINTIYDQGHTVFFMTARGMGRTNNDQKKARQEMYKLTKKQLDSWNVKYHQLFLGKPSADLYIDDKGLSDDAFFDKFI